MFSFIHKDSKNELEFISSIKNKKRLANKIFFDGFKLRLRHRLQFIDNVLTFLRI